jgi:hypothetical protein
MKNSTRPFANSEGMLQGALNLILDGQHPVEILMEHSLTGKMDQYPLIIIPECNYLEASFIEELKKYVSGGGNLLIIGTEAAHLFEKELGTKTLRKENPAQLFIATSDKIGAISSSLDSVRMYAGVKPTSNFYMGSDFRFKGKDIASSVNKVGKGMVAGVYFNAGSDYLEYKSPVLRDFFSSRINELFTDPITTVTGSHLVHVALNKLNNKMYVNLLNVAGEHTNQTAVGYDEIPSLKNLTVQIKTGHKPAKIILQPEGRELHIDFQDGVSKVFIPELAIHSILEIIQ